MRAGLEDGPGDGWRLYLYILGVFLALSLSFGQRYTSRMEKEMATHSSILAWEIHGQRGEWWATVHGQRVAKSHDLATK